MKKSRCSNHLLGSTALAALIVLGAVCFSSNALSAEWPSKQLEFVTHSSPGGPGNLIGHLLADINRKAQILSQPIYVSVKPGSGMAKAFSYIMEKKGDDHIIGVTSSGNILGTPLRVKVPYEGTLQDDGRRFRRSNEESRQDYPRRLFHELR
jgi:tripartite-type tricarboxylate transporter receptor subunit TctC